MSLALQVAKSIYIRRGQFSHGPNANNSPHIYEPGRKWPEQHQAWDNLTESERARCITHAETWVETLRTNSPKTYNYLLNHAKV